MSSYPTGMLPMIDPVCDGQFCTLDICTGPESHGVKTPWFMKLKPVLDPDKSTPPVELVKMDGWVLEKMHESDKESSLFQYCPSEQWKKELNITEIRDGYCGSCCEIIPPEMVAAYTMHNWNMLQKYDADMKKYGADPYAAETPTPVIEVFR